MGPFSFRFPRFRKRMSFSSSTPEQNQLSAVSAHSSADLPPLLRNAIRPPSQSAPAALFQLLQDQAPVQHHSSISSEQIGMFSQAHNFVIYDPQFVEDRTSSYNFLEKLLPHTIIGAEFDSSTRYPPPRCHPQTRLAIVERCKAFITQSDSKERMRWVVGAAGVGKTAIMQIVAEETPAYASVFLSVNGRSDGTKTIVTIAYQFAVKCGPYRRYIDDQISLDPSLLRKPLSIQFNKFIVEPFMLENLFDPSCRYLVIIDGLDECDSPIIQRNLLQLISDFCITYPASPIVWLIASRPEPHITSFFADIRVASIYTKEEIVIDSDEASEDVQQFLRTELDNIKVAYPPLKRKREWPLGLDFTKIATAAGGLFAYASTVIKYIGDPYHGDPVSRLNHVLVAADTGVKDETPLAQLDALYGMIMSNIPDIVIINTRKLLPIPSTYSQSGAVFRLRCNWLGLTEDEAYAAVHHLHAVAKVPTPDEADDEPLYYFHKSFPDFLFDLGRSKFCHIAVEEVEQLNVQAALRLVEEVLDDDDTVGSDLGAYGHLKGGPSSCDSVSLSWPGDERFMKTDLELRLELYHGAMLDICDGFSSRNKCFRSLPCFHALTTRFTALGPEFPYYQLRESIFDNFRHELTKLGQLKQVPLRTLDYAAICGVIHLQFTSPINMDVNHFESWDLACEHEKEEQWRGWSTAFRRSDTAADRGSHHHAFYELPSNNQCDHCSQRLVHCLTDNPDHLASVFIDSTDLSYVEFSIIDRGDRLSEWRYRLLHSGRPSDK